MVLYTNLDYSTLSDAAAAAAAAGPTTAVVADLWDSSTVLDAWKHGDLRQCDGEESDSEQSQKKRYVRTIFRNWTHSTIRMARIVKPTDDVDDEHDGHNVNDGNMIAPLNPKRKKILDDIDELESTRGDARRPPEHDDDDDNDEEEELDLEKPLDDDDVLISIDLNDSETWCFALPLQDDDEDDENLYDIEATQQEFRRTMIAAYRPLMERDHGMQTDEEWLHVVTIIEHNQQYLVHFTLQTFEDVAETWNSKEASRAFHKKRIRSESTNDDDDDSDEEEEEEEEEEGDIVEDEEGEGEEEIKEQDDDDNDDDEDLEYRIIFRNTTALKNLAIIWMGSEGEPQDYFDSSQLSTPNADTNGSNNSNDKNNTAAISENDVIIHSTIGDAFCFAICENFERCERHQTVDRVVGAYKALIRGDEDAIHVVTLSPGPKLDQYQVTATIRWPDPTPLDSTQKVYLPETIGGWPCFCEEGWDNDDKKIRALLHHELQAAVGFLPPHAREYLIQNTPFYINTSLQYGPKVAPINGEGFCYHPDVQWLRDHGMLERKAKCIEMYRVEEYYEDMEVWGPGGSLLHELSHAYHDKMVQDGFDNALIKRCYQQAMKEELYDRIKVRNDGFSGEHDTERAYACTDEGEYFAELSTAFLGGLDPEKEYNKWEPFNRAQLKDFDPRAYQMLQTIWKIDCQNDKIVVETEDEEL